MGDPGADLGSAQELDALPPGVGPEAPKQRHHPAAGTTAQLIQLDDLDAEALQHVRPAAFLTLQTSPGNHQAWVAVAASPADLARRLRKGSYADKSASGATRVAGTVNYKRKYEPNFPLVSVVEARPGHVTTPAALDSLGLLALPEPAPAVLPLKTSRKDSRPEGEREWPLSALCCGWASRRGRQRTRPQHGGFFWCMMAAQRGWSIEETANKLLEVSA